MKPHELTATLQSADSLESLATIINNTKEVLPDSEHQRYPPEWFTEHHGTNFDSVRRKK